MGSSPTVRTISEKNTMEFVTCARGLMARRSPPKAEIAGSSPVVRIINTRVQRAWQCLLFLCTPSPTMQPAERHPRRAVHRPCVSSSQRKPPPAPPEPNNIELYCKWTVTTHMLLCHATTRCRLDKVHGTTSLLLPPPATGGVRTRVRK